MKPFHRSRILLIVLLFAQLTLAKDQPSQVINWPQTGKPVLRFTFGKFKELGSTGKEREYATDTTVENLWNKPILDASFSLYMFDKGKVRIGEGWISVSNVGPGQTVRFQTSLRSSGTPDSLSLVPRSLPAELSADMPTRTISITVNSVPQGAELDLDGTPVGTTPKMVQVGPGKHLLGFRKEGFNSGKFPLEIGPSDVSGGSVSYELGSSAHDTVELRDGSVITGDVESLSGMEAVVRVGGVPQRFDRNQIKRILLVQREAAMP